jgi:hypothetical protein
VRRVDESGSSGRRGAGRGTHGRPMSTLKREGTSALARRVAQAAAIATAFATTLAVAQQATPANTLMDMRRQLGACMSGKPIGPAGSRITIVFMMRRDGSVLGKPRISYSHLEGDAEARRQFLGDAERAIGACLPFKVTPGLGGAIAGRLFSVTLGREKPAGGA